MGSFTPQIGSYVTDHYKRVGFGFVHTRRSQRRALPSGHLPYADTMFPPMLVDGERVRTACNVTKAGQVLPQRYELPRANPHLPLARTFLRELPLRFYELGHDYPSRGKSDVVHGLTCIGFTPGRFAHLLRPGAGVAEIRAGQFFLSILSAFGLRTSTWAVDARRGRQKDKFIGSDEDWAAPPRPFRMPVLPPGLDLVPDGRRGSYRSQRCRFRSGCDRTHLADVTISTRPTSPARPRPGVHRRRWDVSIPVYSSASSGPLSASSVLTETLRGNIPGLAFPVRYGIIPVARAFDGYVATLRQSCVSAECESKPVSDDPLRQEDSQRLEGQIPFTLIVSGDDVEAGAVSFLRDGSQHNGVPVELPWT